MHSSPVTEPPPRLTDRVASVAEIYNEQEGDFGMINDTDTKFDPGNHCIFGSLVNTAV